MSFWQALISCKRRKIIASWVGCGYKFFYLWFKRGSMAKNLVIVESPAKAKTIEGYLGKDFVVMSSFGHVRDLAKKGVAIDVDNGFEPNYEVDPEKKKLVAELKKLSDKSEMVWLATDEDREGEAISWHLKEALKLPESKTKRITFNEITKPAILKAIESPRGINVELVNAQQARRVLDRLVGFELSPVLWRKIKPSLSAGRVQSVAVRLIVEREREILNFTSTSYFRTVAIFTTSDGKSFKADLNKRFDSHEEAESFLKACANYDFSVASVEVKPGKKSPTAPFTTSTLQQEAARKLGFGVAQTMRVAQGLYEAGHITYMRTDSVNLSETALQLAEQAIVSQFGEKYHTLRKYATKNKGAQEAHEAIRPVDFTRSEVDGDANAQRLYDLIWKRGISSQMSDAKIERTAVKINTPQEKVLFSVTGEVIKFDGFLKVYLESTDDDTEDEGNELLPPVAKGDALTSKEISSTQRFTHHPARYTEASLVKKLEELGIGRPSTYAPTISTVQKRGYVSKDEKIGTKRDYLQLVLSGSEIKKEEKSETTGAEKNKLSPTDIGLVVNDFLVEHFRDILDYNFTASVEKQFDDIASGLTEWKKMITDFYQPFHQTVEKTLEESERATGERELGVHPTSGKPIIARIGRFGPMVQIGVQDEEDKPQFASLRPNQSIQTITLEEALDLFKLPRTVGEYEGLVVKANAGRFGPYVQHGKLFVSLKDGLDPMSVDLETSIELIEAKRKADREKLITSFDTVDPPIQVLNGRWGPYIVQNKTNYKLPKGTEADKLTLDDCLKIIKEAPAKKPAKARGKAKK